MDTGRIRGAMRQSTDAAKRTAGRLMGNKKLENRGRAEKVHGHAEETAGRVSDAVRDTNDKDERAGPGMPGVAFQMDGARRGMVRSEEAFLARSVPMPPATDHPTRRPA